MIFRAHGRVDLFRDVQMPLLKSKSFWRAPADSFKPGGGMEQAILEYRKSTGQPLLPASSRKAPARVLQDDDRNLVRSISARTLQLLALEAEIWPILQDRTLSASQKEAAISKKVRELPGFGHAWAKLITVAPSLAYTVVDC